MLPIATVGCMHVCSEFTAEVPHVGGPIVDGMPDMLVTGLPVATVGSEATCVGPPDTVAVGDPTILVNGMPVAVEGSVTAHGGDVVLGNPVVLG